MMETHNDVKAEMTMVEPTPEEMTAVYGDMFMEDRLGGDDDSPTVDVQNIPLEHIIPNAWNPNDMDDVTFNRLTEELQNIGMIDPIQVVPVEDGMYRIIGGAHRYQAAKILGWNSLPCVILSEAKWQDEDLQKFVTVRMNILHGKLNPSKMIGLYEEMAEKYGEDALQQLFAFTDNDAWRQVKKDVADGLKQSGLPKEMVDKFKAASEDVKTVEGLGVILNQLFAKYGNTLDHNFMVFTFGGREHLFISMDKQTKKTMDLVTAFCKEKSVDINDIMRPITAAWLKKVKEDEAILDAIALPDTAKDDGIKEESVSF